MACLDAEDGIGSAKPKEFAIGVWCGVELAWDKYRVSKKWCLRGFGGGHSVDIACPWGNSALIDVSHLRGVCLFAKAASCINSVRRCD